MNVNELVGKRVLLQKRPYLGGGVDEYRVIEVSPSGNWVRLQNINGNKFWLAVTDISLVEVLVDLKAGRPEQGGEG